MPQRRRLSDAAAGAGKKLLTAVAPELGISADVASKALDAVQHDLVVFHGQWQRKKEVKRKVPDASRKSGYRTVKVEELHPVDWEFHVNPVTIGVVGIGAAATAVLGYVAWNGITVPMPLGGSLQLIPGLKNAQIASTHGVGPEAVAREKAFWTAARGGNPGAAIAEFNYSVGQGDTWVHRGGRAWREVQAIIKATPPGLPPGTVPGPSYSCSELQAQYQANLQAGAYTDAARVKNRAKLQGCSWAV